MVDLLPLVGGIGGSNNQNYSSRKVISPLRSLDLTTLIPSQIKDSQINFSTIIPTLRKG